MSEQIEKKPLGEQITLGWQEVENGFLVEGARQSSIKERAGKRMVRIAADRSEVDQSLSIIFDQLRL